MTHHRKTHIATLIPSQRGPSRRAGRGERTYHFDTANCILGSEAIIRSIKRGRIPSVAVQADLPPTLCIDMGHQLTFTQIIDHGRTFGCGNLQSNTAATAAVVKPEHKTGIFLSPAMHPGINTQGPVNAVHDRFAAPASRRMVMGMSLATIALIDRGPEKAK